MTQTRNNQKRSVLVLASIAAALSFMLVSGATMQQAFAHASLTLEVDEEPVEGKEIRVTVGHTNEPTFGAKPGIHDGKHNFEVLLADSDTRLPLTGASLKVDKYYFEDIKAFNKAESLDDADDIEKGITVGSVFGDPGHYMTRQVQKDGIYGYRLYGTINYFGEASVDIDATVFCTPPKGNTEEFNEGDWKGSYGCTEDIDDILFPEKNKDVNPSKTTGKASFEVSGASIQQASDVNVAGASNTLATSSPSESANVLQMFALIGIPAAALASVFGIRSLKQRNSSQQ